MNLLPDLPPGLPADSVWHDLRDGLMELGGQLVFDSLAELLSALLEALLNS
jgi:hypothetical protein